MSELSVAGSERDETLHYAGVRRLHYAGVQQGYAVLTGTTCPNTLESC